LDAGSEDLHVAIMDTDAMATVPGWGETTQGQELADWVAAIMAMEEVSVEASA
jgi:hypothetical protein